MEKTLGFQAQIYNDLEEMPNRITFPDKSNRAKMMAELLMWKRVSQLAEKKYDKLMETLVADELIKDPKSIVTPGTFTIGEAGALTVEVQVSVPRREFNLDWMCKKMQRDHKVPAASTRQIYEAAKQPGSVQTRKITVKEKGVNI